MKHLSVFSMAVPLATFLMICGFASVSYADDVPFYSGVFFAFGGPGYQPGSPTADTVASYTSNTLNFVFEFTGNVTNFQETQWCGLECPQYFTADINSGTVSFSGYDNSGQNPNYNFTGIIMTGGQLSGDEICDEQGCAWDDTFTFNYRSTSGTNGWMSSGELSWTGGDDGAGGDGFGNLTILTQQATTPEPSSFWLLGSGLAGVLGFLRRSGKLRS